jgi:hypothetical protein
MSIINRTVFYDNTGGVVRFWDWALVTTNLGTMAEPFNANMRVAVNTPVVEFDPTDEFVRIDEMRAMPIDASMLYLSGGSMQLHGGYQMPRDGK